MSTPPALHALHRDNYRERALAYDAMADRLRDLEDSAFADAVGPEIARFTTKAQRYRDVAARHAALAAEDPTRRV